MKMIRWAFVVFWLVVALWFVREVGGTQADDVQREDQTQLVNELQRLGD